MTLEPGYASFANGTNRRELLVHRLEAQAPVDDLVERRLDDAHLVSGTSGTATESKIGSRRVSGQRTVNTYTGSRRDGPDPAC